MKALIFSDLHGDVSPWPTITVGPDVDVVICAGDTCEGAKNAFEALRRIVPERIPIVNVLGNHEHYRRSIIDEIALAKELAPSFNIHVLENDSVVLKADGQNDSQAESVRFAGCTLWTDYKIFGDANAMAAINVARHGLNDHRLITWSKKPWLRFRPEEALLTHFASRAYLNETLSVPFDGPTVVLTHHAPHWKSVAPQYQQDILTAAFASDLSEMIAAHQPDIWVHGHVHSSFDYQLGQTRVLCNPRGYWDENPAFNASLTVEI